MKPASKQTGGLLQQLKHLSQPPGNAAPPAIFIGVARSSNARRQASRIGAERAASQARRQIQKQHKQASDAATTRAAAGNASAVTRARAMWAISWRQSRAWLTADQAEILSPMLIRLAKPAIEILAVWRATR